MPGRGRSRFQFPSSIIQSTLDTLNVPGIDYFNQRPHVLFDVKASIVSIQFIVQSLHVLYYHLLPQILNQSLPRLVVCHDTYIAPSQLLVNPGPKLFLYAAGIVAFEGEEHQTLTCLLSSDVNAFGD